MLTDEQKARKSQYGKDRRARETPEQRERRLAQLRTYNAEMSGRRTLVNRVYKRQKRAWFETFKAAPCMDCGVSYPPYVMDFDHRPGEEKVLPVATMISDSWGRERIEAEIAKCDLVCANCHRVRTHLRRVLN